MANDKKFVVKNGLRSIGNVLINTTTDAGDELQVNGTATATTFVGDLTGNVTGQVSDISNFTTTDLAEGTNLYYTQARFDSAFSAKDTDDLSEGATNLYYTQARFDSAFAAKSTSDLSEGTNLYFTNERVDDRVNALLVGGTNISTTYDDVANTLTLAVDNTGGLDLSNNTTTDLAEGTNLYYTQARFDSAFSAKDTDDLSEGVTNLYYTQARFDTDFAAKSTSDLSEGTNLYYTDERVDDRVNALLVDGTNISTTYDDVANTLTVNVDSTGGLDLSNNTTTDLAEGTNLYYTQARFDSAFSGKSTSDLSEGTNLYFTDERVDDRVNGLLVGGTNITLTYDDVANTLTIDAADSTLTQEEVQDFAWNVLTGTQTLITVTYDDVNNNVDFIVNDDLSLYDNTTSGFLDSGDIGSTVQAWDADLDTYSANPLTAAELGQLQNINANTISSTQWSYLAGLDQALSTTDNVTFNAGTFNGVLNANNILGADIVSGDGSGSTALTTNDGGGNANLTFNHRDTTPDASGSSARISSAVDTTTANMDFLLADNVTSGVSPSMTSIMTLTIADTTVRNDMNVVGSIELDDTLNLKGTFPTIRITDTDAAVDEGIWFINGNGGNFTLEPRTDAGGALDSAYQITRDTTQTLTHTWEAQGASMSWDGGILDVGGRLEVETGTVINPGMKFAGELTGFSRTGASQIGVILGGTELGTFTSTGLNASLRAGNGSAAVPSISFESNTDNGFWNKSGSQIGVTVNGTEVMDWGSVSMTSLLPILIQNNTSAVFIAEDTSATSGYERSGFGRINDQMVLNTQTTGATVVENDMIADVGSAGVTNWSFRVEGTEELSIDSTNGVNAPNSLRLGGNRVSQVIYSSGSVTGNTGRYDQNNVIPVSGYSDVRLILESVVVDTDGADIYFYIFQDGVSFPRTGSSYSYTAWYTDGAGVDLTGQTEIILADNINIDGTLVSGRTEIFFPNKTTTSINPIIEWRGAFIQNGPKALAVHGAGGWTNNTGAIAGFALNASTGNITDVDWKVVGIPD